MNIGSAFAVIVGDRRRLRNAVLGGGVLLAGILTTCALVDGPPALASGAGNLVQLTRNIIAAQPHPSPEWAGWGALLRDGCRVLALAMALGSPVLALGLLLGVPRLLLPAVDAAAARHAGATRIAPAIRPTPPPDRLLRLGAPARGAYHRRAGARRDASGRAAPRPRRPGQWRPRRPRVRHRTAIHPALRHAGRPPPPQVGPPTVAPAVRPARRVAADGVPRHRLVALAGRRRGAGETRSPGRRTADAPHQ
jgi:hypothetical protein